MKGFGDKCNPDLEQTPVPVGQLCADCDEPFAEGDSGIWLNNDTLPQHLECFMRQILGSVAHQRKRCACYGGPEEEDMPGFSPRQAALAAFAEYQQQLLQEAGASITCPRCGMTSHNPKDVLYRYCGNCHQFHDPMERP